MGHYYQNLDAPYFDYDLHTVEGLGGRLFRGPAIDPTQPYVACIGAAQTYGRFCHHPFPQQLAEGLGLQVLNLGVGGTGPRFFAAEEYLTLLNRAEAVVVQVLSGRSSSNSLFNNRDTSGLMGVRLTDYKEMRFEHFLEDLVESGPVELVREIVQETRDFYISEFISLLKKIQPPKILLWLSDRSPDYADTYDSPWSILNSYPQIVNRRVIDAIVPFCDSYVECTSREGLPQPLWEADSDIDGALVKDGRLYNHYYPSPEMHDRAAEALLPVCRKYVPAPLSRPGIWTIESRIEPTRFVLLGAERTGTNLLMGMLDSHPDCCTLNEVFNEFFIQSGSMPWFTPGMPEEPELIDLRISDPVRFIERLYATGAACGFRAIGFKLMYGQAESFPQVRDYLLSDPDIHIIHLKRRNLLRRFVSERQALAAGIWAQESGSRAPAPPAVELSAMECVWDLNDKEEHASKYGKMLTDRPNVFEAFYEHLAGDPVSVGRRGQQFLSLEPMGDVEIRYRKTGSERLEDVVSNFAELKARFLRWASYFED